MDKISIEERKKRIFENACATCGGSEDGGGDSGDMTPQNDGEQTDDGNLLKALKKVRSAVKKKNIKEGKQELPVAKMILKASELEGRAGRAKDKEEKFPLYDRVRKIKSNIK